MTALGGILFACGIFLMSQTVLAETFAKEQNQASSWPFFTSRRRRIIWWTGMLFSLTGSIIVSPAVLVT